MKLHARKTRQMRRKTDVEARDQIDSLAKTICPAEEWQAYDTQLRQLSWRRETHSHHDKVQVLPVWKKYRQSALRVMTLHKSAPVLKYLPLRFSCFLGELLFQ